MKTELLQKCLIRFRGRTIEVPFGTNLRRALLQNGLSPYNGKAHHFNCHGLGTCGTCAVEISGNISSKTKMESWRLAFPPHKPGNELRLACQVKVTDHLVVRKHGGFWGHLFRKGTH
ncbi:MAG: 2Fe-2S iron-sulfur cluster binding domain-containing protein [Bacteroidota bacterium]|nr:2Fe-2S iron-sulfur cluster binding domain-containing protein [Bacteroidota bacterium]